ncbi:hypothetical protein MKI88_19700 [Sphingomonas sp. LaA6.9]|nr:hypothetical protein [Sphingomonas sp. LaA6.9]MCJ8159640.1 hypothetical protein [Sphingomonas sp. LaA6.9]
MAATIVATGAIHPAIVSRRPVLPGQFASAGHVLIVNLLDQLACFGCVPAGRAMKRLANDPPGPFEVRRPVSDACSNMAVEAVQVDEHVLWKLKTGHDGRNRPSRNLHL